jgi:small subunit ribosomal protein S1
MKLVMAQKNPATSESFSMADFEKALGQQGYAFAKGQVVTGKAFSYESEGALIDIGGKSPALLPTDEASVYRITDISAVLPLQEEREFLIIADQNADGQVTVSIRKLEERLIWDDLRDMQESSRSTQVKVLDVNKGGVTVNALGLRGFIPRSQLNERENLESLIGTVLSACVIELDQRKGKIVMSNRQASRAASMSQLEVGQLVDGTIASVKPFGAFVEFGGCTGLLHVSQISKKPVESVEKVFHSGQAIKALIVNIDEGKGRISLSTKILEQYEGEALDNLDKLIEEADARKERARKHLMG